MIKSKNTYGQLLHKVFNQEMKHGCELVITGLAAMQGCSYLKSQASGKSWRVPQYYYGNHPTQQNNKCI